MYKAQVHGIKLSKFQKVIQVERVRYAGNKIIQKVAGTSVQSVDLSTTGTE